MNTLGSLNALKRRGPHDNSRAALLSTNTESHYGNGFEQPPAVNSLGDAAEFWRQTILLTGGRKYNSALDFGCSVGRFILNSQSKAEWQSESTQILLMLLHGKNSAGANGALAAPALRKSF